MYKHFVEHYNDIFTFDESLLEALKGFIKPQGKAVDLGCGTGRLVSLLDELGMKSVGVDLDLDMIKKAQEDYPHLSFIHDSMVDFLDTHDTYDLITCFGNTIAHIDEPLLKQLLMRAKKVLKPQGYLLIQLLNYEKILKEKPKELKKITFKNGTFERFYTYHEKSITFTTKLTVDSIQSTGSTTLYPYTKTQLENILEALGFQFKFVTDFKSSALDEHAFHLSIIIQ